MTSVKIQRMLTVLVVVLFVMAGFAGCKRPARVVLSKDQRVRIQENILKEVPTPKHLVNANFGDNIVLLGVDMEPENPSPGQEVKLTWYWQCKRAVEPGWKIFVHLELPKGKRMGLDHVPVGELFPMDQWEPGQYIRDVQTFRLESKLDPGKGLVWAGLYSVDVYEARGSGERMILVNTKDVKNDGENRVFVHEFVLGRALEPKPEAEGAEKSEKDLRLTVPPITGAPIVIDGAMDEDSWKNAAVIGRLTDAFGVAINGEEMTSVRVLHDNDFIYFGISATDLSIEATFKNRDDQLWTQDVFEIYLDGGLDGKDYLEMQFSPANVIFDALFASHRSPEWKEAMKHTVAGLESAVKVDGTLNQNGDRDKGWTMEIKIPASSVPGLANLDTGTEVRANFFRMNMQDGEMGRAHAWGPGGRDFHDLAKMGVMVFTNGVPVVAAKKAAEPQ